MKNNGTVLAKYYRNLQKNGNICAVIDGNLELNYSELDRKSNALAAELIKKGIKPEIPVGIYLPRSASYLISVLGILKSGGCFVPLDLRYPAERLNFIIRDTQMPVIISSSQNAKDLVHDANGYLIIDAVEDIKEQFKDPTPAELHARNLAYIIYTSGSTGQPKGVEIEHRNLVNMLNAYEENFSLDAGTAVTQGAATGFDASIWEFMPALVFKNSIHIIPDEILLNFTELANWLDERKVECCFLSTAIAEKFLEELDRPLKNLRYLTVGGDRLHKRPSKEFTAKLINVYGPAECCIMVSQKAVESENKSHKIPSIGKAIKNTEIYILDENGNEVKQGETGELYISGANVGRGYINLAEETKARFIDAEILGIGKGKVYRTGDLGKQHNDGDYVCLGRTDFQVKIRGQRIELEEIETVLAGFSEIRDVTVRVLSNNQGEKKITAWLGLRQQITEAAIRLKAAQILPSYMLPEYYIFMEKFPLTANGKIDYKALPEQDWQIFRNKLRKPENEIQKKILKIWAGLLKTSDISIDDNFFGLGGHSLLAAQAMVRINKEFSQKLVIQTINDYPTIEKLSSKIGISKFSEIDAGEIQKQPEEENSPLSQGQKELWIIHHLDRSEITHNIMLRLELWGKLDIDIFSKALTNLVNRHTMLHSRFLEIKEEPRYEAVKDIVLSLEIISDFLAEEENSLIEDMANQPFDMTIAPLFRHKLLKYDNEHFVYLMCIHHLITDGWSMGLFIQELGDEYKKILNDDQKSEISKIDYNDFVHWEKESQSAEILNAEFEWWSETLKSQPQPLSLTSKYLRNNLVKYSGKRVWFDMKPAIVKQLREFAAGQNTTLFVVMLSVFKILLAAETGRRDIVVGTPYANRQKLELEKIFGYFTNMLSLSSVIDAESDLQTIVANEHEICQGAFQHSHYSFGNLVNNLDYTFSEKLHPIFQVLFIFQNYPFPLEIFPEVKFDFKELGNKTTNIDFTCNITEKNDKLECWFMYQTELFDDKYITDFKDRYLEFLAELTAKPTVPIKKVVSLKTTPVNSCWLIGETGLLESCAEKLIFNGFYICGIITKDAHICEWATRRRIDCYPPSSDLYSILSSRSFDYLFSIINEIIISPEIFNLARIASINYHDAPLPRYAGIYATTWAIFNAEKEHGISWHLMAEKVDAGDILTQRKFAVSNHDTVNSLNARCFAEAIEGFRELLRNLKSGDIEKKKQNIDLRTYYGLYHPIEDLLFLDFQKTAAELKRNLRTVNFGMHDNEIGIAKILFGGNFYIVIDAEIVRSDTHQPGMIISASENLQIQTGKDILKFSTVYDVDGNEITISEHFIEHEFLVDIRKTNAVKLSRKSRKAERFWKNYLTRYEVLELQFIHKEANEGFITSQVGERIIPELFLLFFALYADQESYSVMINQEIPKRFAGIYSSLKPANLRFDFQKTIAENQDIIIQEFLIITSKARYLRDIYLRYSSLRELEKGKIIVDYANYQIDGTELMVIKHDNIKFNSACFSRSAIEKLLQYWQNFINIFENDKSKTLNFIDFIGKEELEKQLITLNQTEREFPLEKTYPAIFRERLIANRLRIAVESGSHKLTYQELDEESNGLAQYLWGIGIQKGSVVGVCLSRNSQLAITILAILKCGGIYLPLDFEYPKTRLEYMITDSQCEIVIVHTDTKEKLGEQKVSLLNLDEINYGSAEDFTEISDFDSRHAAYIIYTSGSTGKPKGVVVNHRNLLNHNLGAEEIYEITYSDKVLQFSSLSFDISIEEIFPTLLAGACLVFRDNKINSSIEEFVRFIDNYQISIVDLPTAFWHELVDEIDDFKLPACLKAVIVGGEKVRLEKYNKWISATSEEIRFYNTYGPTEATIIASCCKGKREHNWQEFPIGKPVPNCRLYIMDSRFRLRPFGMKGELFIGGDCVSDGYLNKQDLTDKFFLKNPYSKGKLYRSGDIVKYNQDGDIIFDGRKDKQVKINGFRIEPAEIARVIESHSAVRMAYVDSYFSESQKYLVAWIVAANITLKELNEYLIKLLPAYMVPSRIVILKQFPLTVNGKIDIKALPEPDMDESQNYVEPYNEFQRILCRIMAEVLNLNRVSIKDNFFLLGGNSLLSMKVLNRLHHAGMELSINDFFHHEDVEYLSHYLSYRTNIEKSALEFSLVQVTRKSDSNYPLIVCHLSPGDLLGYSALFQELSPQIPVYGLQAPALMDEKYNFSSIEEMAAWYIKVLDKQFGHSDYVLFGHCFGGTLAYEIARQLELEKRAPKELILSETWLFPPERGIIKWRYFLHKIKNIFRMPPADVYHYLQVKLLHKNRVSPFIEINEHGEDNQLFLQRAKVQNHHLRLIMKYHYKTYSKHFDVILAQITPKGLIPDPTLGWNVISDNFKIFRINAKHSTVMGKPAVKNIADIIKEIYTRR